jgi:hypothetical protein
MPLVPVWLLQVPVLFSEITRNYLESVRKATGFVDRHYLEGACSHVKDGA